MLLWMSVRQITITEVYALLSSDSQRTMSSVREAGFVVMSTSEESANRYVQDERWKVSQTRLILWVYIYIRITVKDCGNL